MKATWILAGAVVLAGALPGAGFLLNGRYSAVSTSDTNTKADGLVLVIDRLTGVMWRCGIGVGCIPYGGGP